MIFVTSPSLPALCGSSFPSPYRLHWNHQRSGSSHWQEVLLRYRVSVSARRTGYFLLHKHGVQSCPENAQELIRTCHGMHADFFVICIRIAPFQVITYRSEKAHFLQNDSTAAAVHEDHMLFTSTPPTLTVPQISS